MIGGTLYVILYTVCSALALIITVYVLAMVVEKDIRSHFQDFKDVRGKRTKMMKWVHQLYIAHSSIQEYVISKFFTFEFFWFFFFLSKNDNNSVQELK